MEWSSPRILRTLLDSDSAEINLGVEAFDNVTQACLDKVRLVGAKAVDRPTRHLAFKRGETPLHLAAVNGLADHIQLLLEARADPSRRNSLGLTPGESGLAFGFEYPGLLEDATR